MAWLSLRLLRGAAESQLVHEDRDADRQRREEPGPSTDTVRSATGYDTIRDAVLTCAQNPA